MTSHMNGAPLACLICRPCCAERSHLQATAGRAVSYTVLMSGNRKAHRYTKDVVPMLTCRNSKVLYRTDDYWGPWVC